MAPSTVFFGLMVGASGRRPSVRPGEYCAVSLTTIVAITSSVALGPDSICSATSVPAAAPI